MKKRGDRLRALPYSGEVKEGIAGTGVLPVGTYGQVGRTWTDDQLRTLRRHMIRVLTNQNANAACVEVGFTVVLAGHLVGPLLASEYALIRNTRRLVMRNPRVAEAVERSWEATRARPVEGERTRAPAHLWDAYAHIARTTLRASCFLWVVPVLLVVCGGSAA